MRKFVIIIEYYKWTIEPQRAYKWIREITRGERFDTFEEAKEYCEEENLTAEDLSDISDNKTFTHYRIEEVEVDENNEIISYEYYLKDLTGRNG